MCGAEFKNIYLKPILNRFSGKTTRHCQNNDLCNNSAFCSEPVRLVGQASRCAGMLEVKVGEWRTIDYFDWDLKEAHVVCEHLGCGSAFSIQWKNEPSEISVLKIEPDCVHSGSALRECAKSSSSFLTLNVTCKGKQNHLSRILILSTLQGLVLVCHDHCSSEICSYFLGNFIKCFIPFLFQLFIICLTSKDT